MEISQALKAMSHTVRLQMVELLLHKKDDCFRRASYLAKTNTKGTAPKGQRELFSSRIPKEK